MQFRPDQKNTNISIEQQVENILKEFFPHHSIPKTPAQAKEFDEIKQLVLQDARKNQLILEPENIRIPSITKLIETRIIEKTIENALETYTGLDKNSKEANNLREHIKNELDKLAKNNKNFGLMMKNNKIRDTLVALHVENYCVKNKIKLKPGITNQFKSLQLECEKLLNKLMETHPELSKAFRRSLDNSKKEGAKEELNTLINIILVLNTITKNLKDLKDLPPPGEKTAISAKPKEFGDLSEAEQTQVVTLGSKAGGGFNFDRSKLRDDPLPDVTRPNLSSPIDVILEHTAYKQPDNDAHKPRTPFDINMKPDPDK